MESVNEFLELEESMSCSDSIKVSRLFIVVACSESGKIQIYSKSSKEILVNQTLYTEDQSFNDF